MYFIVAFLVCLALGANITPLYSEADLKKISECLTCQYVLLTDITLTSSWTAIGSDDAPFEGMLDGQGHTITFADITVTSDGNAGLFGAIDTAEIFDLRLIITGSVTGIESVANIFFGLLAGSAVTSTVYGCAATLTGTVSKMTGTIRAGGMFGSSFGCRIDKSYSKTSLTIKGTESLYLGGLSGNMTSTDVTNCETYVLADVMTTTSIYLGGLAGLSSMVNAQGVTVKGVVEIRPQSTIDAIGGLVGSDTKGTKSSNMTSCVVDFAIELMQLTNTTIGGVAGLSASMLAATNCNVVLAVKAIASTTATALVVGGTTGIATGELLDIMAVYANMSLIVHPSVSNQFTVHAGGAVGKLSSNSATINQSAAVVDILATAKTLVIGGLIGRGDGPMAIIQNSGVLGIMAAKSEQAMDSNVGGIAGIALNMNISSCYFIGNISATSTSEIVVGGLVCSLSNSQMISSYVLANLSAIGSQVKVGSVASQTSSNISNCYAAVNITTAATVHAAVGGLVGLFGDGSTIKSSFAMATTTVNANTGFAYVGGFVGDVGTSRGNEFIVGCYSWGSASAEATAEANVTIGGFAGALCTSMEVTSCIAYVNISAPKTKGIAGLFASALPKINTATSPPSGSTWIVKFTVAYVMPGGGLTDVKRTPTNGGIIVEQSYCAKYPNTFGCVTIASLNSKVFLSEFDFVNTFQLDNTITNGSVSLRILPVPQSESTTNAPKFVLPAPAKVEAWSSKVWQIDTTKLGGFLVLGTIDYQKYCSTQNSCYGVGLSPLNFKCNPGWTSPPWNTSSFVSNLCMCNMFACSQDVGCYNGGSCSEGRCTCKSGYTGPSCLKPICPETGGAVCGTGSCAPFADKSLTGVCKCSRTEYFTSSGQCLAGCQQIGFGICKGPNHPVCFEGYSTESGCLKYDCSVVTNSPCNGKGTCNAKTCTCDASSILLDGNCYTLCTADVTTECITANCGAGNSCSNNGLCVPSRGAGTASCVCNMDSNGQPTETHFGGPLCADCASGYVKNEENCVLNSCLKCDGGVCKYDATANAVVCTCSAGFKNFDGSCVKDNCPKCDGGKCDYDAIANAIVCICSPGSINYEGSCVKDNCQKCEGGECKYNSTENAVVCTCKPEEILQDGKCLTDACGGKCRGECKPIPNGANPEVAFCICASQAIGTDCYELDCDRCTDGTCTPSSETMKIQCSCSGGLVFNATTGACEGQHVSTSGLAIGLSVGLVCAAVIAGVVTAIILIRRKKTKGLEMGSSKVLLK